MQLNSLLLHEGPDLGLLVGGREDPDDDLALAVGLGEHALLPQVPVDPALDELRQLAARQPCKHSTKLCFTRHMKIKKKNKEEPHHDENATRS